MTQMTAPQQKMLQLLRDHGPATAGELARQMWPDSPAWTSRTRRYGANRNGALGGTMPMLAAKLLWALREHGAVRQTDDGRWAAFDRP